MEASGGSQWALVFGGDGEASVVPLCEVAGLPQDDTTAEPTIIVLQAHSQDDLTSEGTSEVNLGESGTASTQSPEDTAAGEYVNLAGGESVEEPLDSAVITIADTSQHLQPIVSTALENIQISILSPEELPPTTADLLPPSEPAGASHSPGSSSVEQPQHPDLTPPTAAGEAQSSVATKQECFRECADRWRQRLAVGSVACEPFEQLEARLHKDLVAQLGLSAESGVFISLHQDSGRGVRVVETGPGQLVVSGCLPHLLAAREKILQEVAEVQGVSWGSAAGGQGGSSSTRDAGVMCELLPSPPTPRYASSLGLDRSARRHHTVLSRPLSPEPSVPHRRRPRKPFKLRANEKRHKLKPYSKKKIHKKQQPQVSKNTDFTGAVKAEKNSSAQDTFPSLSFQGYIVEESQGKDRGERTRVKSEPEEGSVREQSDNRDSTTVSEERVSGVVGDLVVSKTHDGSLTLSSFLEEVMKPKRSEAKKDASADHRALSDGEGGDRTGGECKVVCGDLELMVTQEGDLTKTHHFSDEMKFKFSCEICSYKSMRENHFLKHMQLHDKGLALYRCSECSFVSIRPSHLRRHKMSHAQQVLHCQLCAYTCDDQKLLTKHNRVKHQAPKQPKPASTEEFECSECDYKTSWQYAFQRHRRTHSSSKMVVTHSCPQCPYKTVRREHFLRHIKNVHQNYRPFLCDICGKAFKRQDALKQHYVSHYHSLEQQPGGQAGPYGFVCHICQKVCRSAAYLKEHMATHSEERSFLCEVCGASFKTRSVQRNHVQTIHRRPRAFTCHACDKKFNTKFALQRHMKQHELDATVQEGEGGGRTGGEGEAVGADPSRIYDLHHNSAHTTTQGGGAVGGLERGRSPHAQGVEESSPHPATPPYHITIDGQPAFLLPPMAPSQQPLEEPTDTLSEGGGGGLQGLGEEGGAVTVPVGPTTVHILNQDPMTGGAGNLILSTEQYEGGRGSTVVASDGPGYIGTQHGSSTLLYLTTNFN